MRKIVLSLITFGIVATGAACSSSDGSIPDSELGEELNQLPNGVGFVFVDTGAFGTYERCVATLISPTTIVTKSNCLSTEFSPTTNGGPTPSGAKVYFVPANGVSTRSRWIEVTKVKRYQRTALATLAKASPLSPVPVTSTPLGQTEVGSKFLAPYAVGGVYKPTLKSGTTQLRAVSGQGMKAIYPTLADWANATQTGAWVNIIIQDGPTGVHASSWQHPLLNNYESVTKGARENALTVADGVDSQGGPLLRKVANGYEVVGIAYDVIGTEAESGAGKNAVLASYFTTVTKDIAAFLGGAKYAENHCLDVPLNTGVCIDGFSFNCTDWSALGGAPSVEDPEEVSSFCGKRKCVVKPYTGTVKGSSSICQ